MINIRKGEDIMTVTKDQMARDLADKTGYYLKDVKVLLSAMDEVVKEYFAEVSDDNEVSVQIVEGVKILCKVVPERERVNPATGEPVVCKATVKPGVKYSTVFRDTIQKQYEKKKAK
jgi:nucleoid DNA-binding protein